MTDDPLVVTLLTAHRLDYACETVRALGQNLVHDGPVWLHIADDGDDDNYIGAIADQWKRQRGIMAPVTTSQAGGRGYGASMNLSQQTTHQIGRWQMPVEDDWILQRPLDTAPILKVLTNGGHQSREEFRWAVPPPEDFFAQSVRLGYLGFQWPVRADLFKVDETLWMALDPDSPEQNIQAGHPRIETVEYQRAVGPWNETTNPGMTELDWVQRPAARRGVCWPLTIVSLTGSVSGDLFAHCGAVSSYVRES